VTPNTDKAKFVSVQEAVKAMDGNEWSPSCPNCFNPEESACGTQWIRGLGRGRAQPVITLRRIEKYLPLPGIERWILGCPPRRLVSIPITGSQNIWIRAWTDVTDFARRTTTPTAKRRWTFHYAWTIFQPVERRVTFLWEHRAVGKGQRHLCHLQLLWCPLCDRH